MLDIASQATLVIYHLLMNYLPAELANIELRVLTCWLMHYSVVYLQQQFLLSIAGYTASQQLP